MEHNFEGVLPEVLKHEGGFVDHPRDPGGATNKGITIATFRAHVDKNGSVADLRALTTEQAGIIYKAHYWDKIKGDDLPSGLDYAVFDFAVNSGPARAAKYVQAIAGVTQDGSIGPETLGAVRRVDPDDFINSLCDNRLAFMKRARDGALWQDFGKGWSRRVADVRKISLSLVDVAAPSIPEDEPEPTLGLPAFLVEQGPAPIQKPIAAVRPVERPVVADAVKPPKTVAKSTTIRAVVAVVAANVGQVATTWSGLDDTSKVIVAALGAIVLIAGLWIFSERIKKMVERGI